jgi:ABC-type multidrug transport system fused ATPase/permease subunit
MVSNETIILIGVSGVVLLVIFFLLMLFYSIKETPRPVKKESSVQAGRDRPGKSSTETIEGIESKRLFLTALLAEYNKLNMEMTAQVRNVLYLQAILFGGTATLVGIVGVVGVFSLLLIPPLTSYLGLIGLSEIYSVLLKGKYIREEIEANRIRKLFPHESPLQWETQYQREHLSIHVIAVIGIFMLAFLLCIGCLVVIPLAFWKEVCSNLAYQSIYYGGWVMMIFSLSFDLIIIRRLWSFRQSAQRRPLNDT